MSDNCITVTLRCPEIIATPLMRIIVDLDKVNDPSSVDIDVSREDLTLLGEMATWYHT